MTRRFCLFLMARAAYADIAAPRLGFIVDRAGSLRQVNGVVGAFTLGEAIHKDVLSAAYSGKTLVVKKDRELLVDGKAFEAPAGPAIITFEPNGTLAKIFFPREGQLWTWRGTRFEEYMAAAIDTAAIVRDGCLFLHGVQVPLKSHAIHVSQMGENWLVIYAEKLTYALRDAEIFELPEDTE